MVAGAARGTEGCSCSNTALADDAAKDSGGGSACGVASETWWLPMAVRVWTLVRRWLRCTHLACAVWVTLTLADVTAATVSGGDPQRPEVRGAVFMHTHHIARGRNGVRRRGPIAEMWHVLG